MEYTDIDLLDYWNTNVGNKKTRKRKYLDLRNYIMGLLYYKFGYSEHDLAPIFEVDRSTINHAKKLPYVLSRDPDFKENTKELSILFPYVFLNNVKDPSYTRLHKVSVKFEKDDIDRLRKYAKNKNIRIGQASKEIVNKYLSKWGR